MSVKWSNCTQISRQKCVPVLKGLTLSVLPKILSLIGSVKNIVKFPLEL
ncbi:hypothetical protein E2C01_078847 [Portunus trituberculatus]|uniref:Uncharacterized protein n=1 Tax=Portunus trituberculatus TaxID=210409 RepID=A0A5B7IHW9_PORTR|nr:hypothetical protein [Portunus trituberculatus]